MQLFRPDDTLQELGRRLSFPVDAGVRESVAREQLRMVWTHARTGLVVSAAFAVLLAWRLAGDAVSAALAFGWLAGKLLVSALRLYQGWEYERRDRPGGSGWRRATHIGLLLDGALWGAAGLALMSGAIPVASLVGAAMAGVSCVATFGLQVSRRATAAYVMPILLPTALGLLLRGDDFGWSGGTGLLMLLGLQLITAGRSEHRVIEGELLRLQAQALAHEKDEALKLALRQSAVKTQFLANISHELRTPLHGILGLARLLHLEAHDSSVARRVELIEASGTHLLSLINDLLDISRVETGRFAMRSESFDLAAQIDNVAEIYAVRAEEKGLIFNVTLALPRPCWVSGDPARYRQVLHNLLGNAIKFTQRGSVDLRVIRGEGPDVVRADVCDSGPGIGEEDLAHVFEAFRQSADASADPRAGAGLGLTIAREIAQAMGGDILARSALGVGTTMVFTARLPGAVAPRPVAAPAAVPAPAGPAAGECRVLMAEDDDVNALIASSYLQHFGISVERVRNGKEAVRHALREMSRPDLILMDCRMPTMDGFAATREIRLQERAMGLARVPVVALTATAADSDRQQCIDAGMDDFLSKPYTQQELNRVIKRWIESRPVSAPRRDGTPPQAR